MKKIARAGLIVLFLAMFGARVWAGEHGGAAADEKKAQEHGGQKMHEHGGKKAKTFKASQIKLAIQKHISKTSDAKGLMMIHDDQTEEHLGLKFIKIHDPVRVMKEKGQYFACTDFHVADQKEKIYDIDFWLEPQKGELQVVQTKVHKHPVKKQKGWIKQPRYTFQGEDIVAIP